MISPIEQRDVVDRIEASGQLIAKAEATVASPLSGEITQITVEEADTVSEGDALLTVDPERRQLEWANAKAQLAVATAQLADRKRELGRVERLSKNNAASDSMLDEAETGYSLAISALSGAEARLGLSRRALEDSTVRAPFSGVIARRYVSTGEYLSTGLPLFELVALDPIEVEFDLAEVDSSRIQLGMQVEVSVAPYPDESFRATVSMISPTINPRTRTLRVKAGLPNPSGKLRPGLFAHVNLGVEQRSGVMMVPEDAVLQRASGPVLFRLSSDEDPPRVERIPITTGVMQSGWLEVRGEIKVGDPVVVRGQGNLEPGSVVSLRTKEGRPTGLSQGANAEPAYARGDKP